MGIMHIAAFASAFCRKIGSAFLGLSCFLVFALCASPALWSQAIGSIIGTVADPSGAVVAGATVTATNVDTQVAKSVVTGGVGEFTLSNLPVGKYNLTANAQGFSIAHVDAMTLDVSQTRNIDFKVVPGGESQTAIVTAAPEYHRSFVGRTGF